MADREQMGRLKVDQQKQAVLAVEVGRSRDVATEEMREEACLDRLPKTHSDVSNDLGRLLEALLDHSFVVGYSMEVLKVVVDVRHM